MYITQQGLQAMQQQRVDEYLKRAELRQLLRSSPQQRTSLVRRSVIAIRTHTGALRRGVARKGAGAVTPTCQAKADTSR